MRAPNYWSYRGYISVQTRARSKMRLIKNFSSMTQMTQLQNLARRCVFIDSQRRALTHTLNCVMRAVYFDLKIRKCELLNYTGRSGQLSYGISKKNFLYLP